jgi:acetylornithine deacetylase/succinyl-diaminopimelate desuccinylase-like protein
MKIVCLPRLRSRWGLVLAAILASPALAQQPAAVPGWVAAHQRQIVEEYLQMVAIPNVHGDVPHLEQNAAFLQAMLNRHGFTAQIWNTSGAPVVFGEHRTAGAKKTLLFYIHFDGQPVAAKEWAQPDPFIPVLRDDSIEAGGKIVDAAHAESFPPQWRIYARSAGDDKVPIEALCAAMDAIADQPSVNVKVFLHGEEEGSGPSLDEVLPKHAAELAADVMLLLDGPQHASGRPTIYYGARGGAGLEVTVYTANSAMHSGNYGNWMPDANVRLAQLIASMVSGEGRVAIKDFYADVPAFSPDVQRMLDRVPDPGATMQHMFGVNQPDAVGRTLQEDLNLPSFSIHTMQGGEAGGVIAAQATAQIAMRLVVENKPQVMIDRVIDHIRAQGYFVVDHDPDTATLAAHPRVAKITYRVPRDGESGAWRTDPNIPIVLSVRDTLERTSHGELVEIRTLGGSVPATPFIQILHLPVVGMSLANYDDNQHTNNENLRLGNLWDGIATLSALLGQ